MSKWVSSDGLSRFLSNIKNYISNNYAGKSHSHTKSEITDLPSTFPPSAHTHDDRYYTESEINTKFSDLKPSFTTLTIASSNWDSNNSYSFETTYPSSTYNVEISLDLDNTTVTQIQAFNNALIIGSGSQNIIKALGGKPSVSLNFIVKVTKK